MVQDHVLINLAPLVDARSNVAAVAQNKKNFAEGQPEHFDQVSHCASCFERHAAPWTILTAVFREAVQESRLDL
jgi:hypothetical protein